MRAVAVLVALLALPASAAGLPAHAKAGPAYVAAQALKARVLPHAPAADLHDGMELGCGPTRHHAPRRVRCRLVLLSQPECIVEAIAVVPRRGGIAAVTFPWLIESSACKPARGPVAHRELGLISRRP